MFDTTDAIILLLLYCFCFRQAIYLLPTYFAEYYETKRKHLLFKPHPAFFGFAWNFLYGCMMVSGFFFLRQFDTPYYIGLFVTFFVGKVLNEQWTVWFFYYKRTEIALVIAILLFINATLFVIFAGLHLLTICLIFYGILAAFYILVIIWNVQWMYVTEISGKTPVQSKAPYKIPKITVKPFKTF